MAEIAGLKLIVPSSVAGSGVSVSSSGKVTFTAATGININGCFTSSYDNYLVVIRANADSSASGMKLRFRAGGTDNSTASSYVTQNLLASSTTVSGTRTTNNITTDILAAYATQRAGAHLYFYGPYLAQPTAGRSVTALDNSSATITDCAFTHNQSTAYDGFTLIGDTNMTGALTIYGLSQ